jgi:hypothetical protein
MAEEIRQALESRLDETVSQRALKEGIGGDEARQKILDEQAEKARKSGEEAEAKRKQEFDERLQAKEQDDPRLKGLLGAAAETGFATGGVGRSYDQTLAMLKQHGLQGPEAERAAREMAGQQASQGFEKFLAGGEKPRQSEVMASSGLADAVQRGVGGSTDTAQKQLRVAERQLEVLTQLAQQNRGGMTVRLRRT